MKNNTAPLQIKGKPSDAIWKLYLKTPDGVTVPLFTKMQRWTANHRKEVLSKLYPDWHGKLLVLK